MIKGKIVSDSMVPTLLVGQEIQIEPTSPEKLKRFDIIVFKVGNELCAHFFWGRQKNFMTNDETFITRSLKNPTFLDFPIRPENIIGKVEDVKLSLWQKFCVYFKIIIFSAVKKECC